MRGVTPTSLRLAAMLLLLWAAAGLAHAIVPVRVLLADGLPQLTLSFPGAHHGAIDGRTFATPLGLDWPMQVAGDSLLLDGSDVGRVLELGGEDGVVFQGRRYRGSLRLIARDGVIRVVNVLDLESYLRGVVPSEMQASWHVEALKAQAVAARTYTLVNLSPQSDYDVCATDDCQVYGGMDAEHPATDQALLATEGQVLTYQGDFARTYYHADSGGVIASSAEVWGGELPYLQTFQDVVSDGPHRRWTLRLEPARVAQGLNPIGLGVGSVQGMRVLQASASGRVLRAEVWGSAGRSTLSGATLRQQLRSWGLKSTRFVMTGDLSVSGEGWGHGVGMSQYGARALAEAGYSYSQILRFYYPDTQIQRLTVQAAR